MEDPQESLLLPRVYHCTIFPRLNRWKKCIQEIHKKKCTIPPVCFQKPTASLEGLVFLSPKIYSKWWQLDTWLWEKKHILIYNYIYIYCYIYIYGSFVILLFQDPTPRPDKGIPRVLPRWFQGGPCDPQLSPSRPCHGSSSWGSVQEPWPGQLSFSARAIWSRKVRGDRGNSCSIPYTPCTIIYTYIIIYIYVYIYTYLHLGHV